MNDYVIKYLIGGYGAYGRINEYHGCGNTHEDILNQFWKQYECLMDCVKPVILGLYKREQFETRSMWEKREIQLTKQQTYGY